MAKALYSGSECFFLSDAHYFEQTHNYLLGFRDHLLAEPALRGRVLDIGCGADIPPVLADICNLCRSMDGVDPDPAVTNNPRLTNRWNAPLEKADIPSASYDLAFAFNVAEHIARPREFFTHIRRILKPGGVFWALTPHHRHLFCWLARGAELAGTKGIFHRHDPAVNSYSSYYRMNSRRQVLKSIGGLGFKEARFHYYPGGWSQYFPKPLRWVGGMYDKTLGYRKMSRMLIVEYRLQADG